MTDQLRSPAQLDQPPAVAGTEPPDSGRGPSLGLRVGLMAAAAGTVGSGFGVSHNTELPDRPASPDAGVPARMVVAEVPSSDHVAVKAGAEALIRQLRKPAAAKAPASDTGPAPTRSDTQSPAKLKEAHGRATLALSGSDNSRVPEGGDVDCEPDLTDDDADALNDTMFDGEPGTPDLNADPDNINEGDATPDTDAMAKAATSSVDPEAPNQTVGTPEDEAEDLEQGDESDTGGDADGGSSDESDGPTESGDELGESEDDDDSEGEAQGNADEEGQQIDPVVGNPGKGGWYVGEEADLSGDNYTKDTDSVGDAETEGADTQESDALAGELAICDPEDALGADEGMTDAEADAAADAADAAEAALQGGGGQWPDEGDETPAKAHGPGRLGPSAGGRRAEAAPAQPVSGQSSNR